MKCLYHANCNDGSASALAVWMKYGDIGHEYIPVQYGSEPPEGLEDTDVVMVDFSYKKEQIRDLARKANSILIIDHHKTAQAELENVDDGYGCTIETMFDMNKSGAVLTWEYFHGYDIPEFFKYIQDRDLWEWKLEKTADITKGLQLHDDWREWKRFIESPNLLKTLFTGGAAINRYLYIQSEKIINTCPIKWDITGDTVPVYNLPGFMLSDTLHMALEMYPDSPYAVGYFDLPDKRIYSLRSRKGSEVDVSEIAKKYGGGGHKHAAGFTKE
jgi:oligoribonuclease NrnB/cAMP/cGMP phosphodiesterase (DHH superfamily)